MAPAPSELPSSSISKATPISTPLDTPTAQASQDYLPSQPASSATPLRPQRPVDGVEQGYRVKVHNQDMQDHYSQLDLAEFKGFFQKWTPMEWPEAMKTQIRNIPRKEDNPCYEAFCEVFNDAMNMHGLGHVMKNTSSNRQAGEDSLSAPDLCLYPDEAQKAYALGTDQRGTRAAAQWKHKAVVSWAWAVLFMEIKMNPKWEPFRERPDGKFGLAGTKLGAHARAQNIGYAMRIQRYQHRRFVFSASIQETKARFWRWDRNGVVISTEFDYIQSPETLLDFVYYIASAKKSDQGYDEGFRRLDPNESLALRDEIQNYAEKLTVLDKPGFDTSKAVAYLKSAAEEIIEDLRHHPLHEVECEDASAPGTYLRYYVGKHRAASWSPVGRGTKVYVAFNKVAKDIAILKDYWCVIGVEGVPNEVEVLKEFSTANISNVPTILSGGFVDQAITISQKYIEETSGCSHPPRQNLRFVVKEVGRTLASFQDARELVQAIYDAFRGHRAAYRMTNGILHRDISYTNILIDIKTGEGFMNDWDMCKRVVALGKGPTQHSRSGTWPYMAAMLQLYPRMYNMLPHDLESFVYALVVPTIQFFPHSYTDRPKAFAPIFHETFNSVTEDDAGFACGGRTKRERIKDGQPEWQLKAVGSPLDTLIGELYGLLQSYWQSLKDDFKAIEAHWSSFPGGDPDNYPIPNLMAFEGMSSHDAVDAIFQRALSTTDGWDPRDGSLAKTRDQLEGLFDDQPALPHMVTTSAIWMTSHKRPRESDSTQDSNRDKKSGKFTKTSISANSKLPPFLNPGGSKAQASVPETSDDPDATTDEDFFM